MKYISFFLVLLLFSVQHLAIASDVKTVVSVIITAKPQSWHIGRIDYENRPWWSRSNDKCVLLELYGPALSGYVYYDVNGYKITERHFINEALVLWITPEGFDDGWNVFTKAINWFSPWAIKFPEQLAKWNNIEIFADESGFVTPEHQEWHKNSPPGTRTAYPIPSVEGKSWPTWQSDLRLAIEKQSPTGTSRGPSLRSGP